MRGTSASCFHSGMIHFAQGASELCYLDSAFLASCGSSLERRAAALTGAELAVHVKMFLSITLPGHKSPCRAVKDSVCTAREKLKKNKINKRRGTYISESHSIVYLNNVALYCIFKIKGSLHFSIHLLKYFSLQLLHTSVLPHLISEHGEAPNLPHISVKTC